MNNLDCVKIYNKNNCKILEINTEKAVYQEKKWKDLSEYQKRKFENLIFLKNNTGEEIKIIYI